MINYSASSVEGSFFAVINVNNTDSGAVPVSSSVDVNVTFSGLNVTIISPSQASPLTNVTSGQTLTMLIIYLAYGGDVVGNNTTWNITIGDSECPIINYSYSDSYWGVSCYAPNLIDGRAYNLSAIAHHAVYGDRTGTQINAIVYRDITSPWFNITRNSINKGNNINLQVNISDNVNVSTSSAVLTYPNETTSHLSLTFSSGSN